MEHQIRFWKNIFTQYSQDQIVVHDTADLDRVYSVLDYRSYAAAGMTEPEIEPYKKAGAEAEEARLKDLFMRLQAGTPRASLTPADQRIYDMFRNDPDPYKFQRAADDRRLRWQHGIRERFGSGYRLARRYFPEMERIFVAEGLPPELTRLPLIESCFNVDAYSKVGATGIWQFMPGTGRLYMMVNGSVDERRDPIASTRAAARFLTASYSRLGSWPLAITAYNHGPAGVARGVEQTGRTDISSLIRYYDGPGWGFSSRNFYAEFLAALDIDKNPDTYFGRWPKETLPPTRTVMLDRPVDIFSAAQIARIDRNGLADLNPALMEPVVSGRTPIPAGYGLRVPADGADAFTSRLAQVAPADDRVARATTPDPPGDTARRAAPPSTTHRVKAGQTLTGIAEQYGVSVDALCTANGLNARSQVRRGQVLRIPRDT
jgi:membrane-bound lytic murein transglycosylase D